jgi:hypothetical protein
MWDIAQTATLSQSAFNYKQLFIALTCALRHPFGRNAQPIANIFQQQHLQLIRMSKEEGATALLLSVKQTVERGTKVRRPHVL